MARERDILRRIEALPEPRHLFIFPAWADPAIIDTLIRDGYLSCHYQQRDERGSLSVAMDLLITSRGHRLAHPRHKLQTLFFRTSLAGASFMGISLLILYLG